MEEIFFFEDGAKPLPASEVSITKVKLKPYPDCFRLHTSITISPSIDKPNLSITISTGSGITIVTAEILEPLSTTTDITLHLPSSITVNELHTLTVELYYQDQPIQDHKIIEFYPNENLVHASTTNPKN